MALRGIGGGLETVLFKLSQFFGAYVPDGVKVFHFLMEMLENGAFIFLHCPISLNQPSFMRASKCLQYIQDIPWKSS
jgi:hypothetical protein